MILIDTSVLVALVDERDRLRSRAMAELGKLKGPLEVLDAVLVETYFLLNELYLRQRLASCSSASRHDTCRSIPRGGAASSTGSKSTHVTSQTSAMPCSSSRLRARSVRSGPMTASSESSGDARTARRYGWSDQRQGRVDANHEPVKLARRATWKPGATTHAELDG